ncbi:MAG: hypothetical protein IKO72_16040 [Kiritimatiellae bacterium]|nr:hypothetical protein [Kiritimatiellia bacterium]
MLLKVITKYGLAVHLGILAAFPVAFAQFLEAGALGRVILWLSLFALIWVLFEPSIRQGERSSDARERVRDSIIRDPVFYFFLLAIGFAVVRWLNTGIALWYDPERAVWTVKDSFAPMLPASVGSKGFLPMAASVGLGVFVIGVRHGLGLSARRFCGMTMVTVAGIGGLMASVCACLGAFPEMVQAARSSFTTLPFAGTPFGVFLILSIVFGVDSESHKWPLARLPFILAVGGSSSALVIFSPPFVAAVYLLVTLLVVIFSLAYNARVGSMGGFARSAVFTLLGLSVPALLIMGLSSPELQQFKLHGLDPESAMPVEYGPLTDALARIAKKMWLERPWCGVGVGAFGLHAPFIAAKPDWAFLPPHPVDAVSGYWTILSERGIVGCGLLAIGVGLLVWSWVMRLVEALAYLRGNDEGERLPFACPPVVWTGPFILGLAVAELFFSHLFASVPAVFAVVSAFALSAASFPRNVCATLETAGASNQGSEGQEGKDGR